MKISNPFKRRRVHSHQKHDKHGAESPSRQPAHPARSPGQPADSNPHRPSPREILDELARIQTNVHLISARIQHLQDLISRDCGATARVAVLIRRLEETHAELRIYHEAVEGGDAADIVGDVAQRVQSAIDRLVDAETRILGGNDGEDAGATMMSGALPIVHVEDSSSDTMSLLSAFPCATTHLPSSSSPIPTSWNPRPRTQVIGSLLSEESQTILHIHHPETPRRGSADGFTITYMLMSRAIDDRFVLPFFAHMTHREVRALKDWLARRQIVTKRGDGVSRIEKVVQCVLLLQTGMRYESLAVLFSRTPAEVVGACGEVMDGVLEIHREMVRDGEELLEVDGGRWGIMKRYEGSEEAEEYFGYSWGGLQKVLGALDAFIARYRVGRSQSAAPRKNKVWWGRFGGVASNEVVWEDLESYRGSSDGVGEDGDGDDDIPTGGLHARYDMLEERHEGMAEDRDPVAEDRENGTNSPATRRSSSPYEEPNLQAIPRPLVEGH